MRSWRCNVIPSASEESFHESAMQRFTNRGYVDHGGAVPSKVTLAIRSILPKKTESIRWLLRLYRSLHSWHHNALITNYQSPITYCLSAFAVSSVEETE
jgi:hypothetical protein